MIVDTGVLYALVDRSDRHHRAAKRLFASRELKIVPEPVVVETDWLILERLGPEIEGEFLAGLGTLRIEAPEEVDRVRAAEIVAKYRELELGYVDAIVVALAEKLDQRRIATVDRRHFSVVRPRHVASFELVP